MSETGPPEGRHPEEEYSDGIEGLRRAKLFSIALVRVWAVCPSGLMPPETGFPAGH